MMQDKMRPAMREEQMLGVIIDAGLQHDIKGQGAEDEAGLAPQRRLVFTRQNPKSAAKPGQAQKRGEKFGPMEFPGKKDRQMGGKRATDNPKRRSRR
jgi:hypothetical protein